MTIAERIKLHQLGYSKEEIKEMIAAESAPAPASDPALSADNGQNPPQPEQIAPDETAKAPEMSATNAQVLAAIKDLTAAIQASNINKTAQPETAPENVENIITGIINAGERN